MFSVVIYLLSQWEFLSHGKFGSLFQKESQLQQSRAIQTLINYKVHAGSFRVSVIHRTLTWTTSSLTCVRDHYYACVNTRGTPTASQHNMFHLGKFAIFSCAPDGVRTSGVRILSPTLYQLKVIE